MNVDRTPWPWRTGGRVQRGEPFAAEGADWKPWVSAAVRASPVLRRGRSPTKGPLLSYDGLWFFCFQNKLKVKESKLIMNHPLWGTGRCRESSRRVCEICWHQSKKVSTLIGRLGLSTEWSTICWILCLKKSRGKDILTLETRALSPMTIRGRSSITLTLNESESSKQDIIKEKLCHLRPAELKSPVLTSIYTFKGSANSMSVLQKDSNDIQE